MFISNKPPLNIRLAPFFCRRRNTEKRHKALADSCNYLRKHPNPKHMKKIILLYALVLTTISYAQDYKEQFLGSKYLKYNNNYEDHI